LAAIRFVASRIALGNLVAATGNLATFWVAALSSCYGRMRGSIALPDQQKSQICHPAVNRNPKSISGRHSEEPQPRW
jgi:hypothetical protein